MIRTSEFWRIVHAGLTLTKARSKPSQDFHGSVRSMRSQAERSLTRKKGIMLHSIQQRYGEKLRATDGEIGHVRDFYFDDKTWTIRYLVADTGGWLSGRQVLISPHA